MRERKDIYIGIIFLLVIGGMYVMFDPQGIFSTTITAPTDIPDGTTETWGRDLHVLVQSDLSVEGTLNIQGAHITVSPGVKIYVEDGGTLTTSDGARFDSDDLALDGQDPSDWWAGLHFKPGSTGRIDNSEITQATDCVLIQGPDVDVVVEDSDLFECTNNILVINADEGGSSIVTVVNSTIYGSNFGFNPTCIRLEQSSVITMFENTITSCRVALLIGERHPTDAFDHINAWHNVFINNDQQVAFGGAPGSWPNLVFNSIPDVTIETGTPDEFTMVSEPVGNYWSDQFICSDSDENGYCDNAYSSTSGFGDFLTDNAPKATSYQLIHPDVEISSISSPSSVTYTPYGKALVDETVTFIFNVKKGQEFMTNGQVNDCIPNRIRIDFDGDTMNDVDDTPIQTAYQFVYTSVNVYGVRAKVSCQLGGTTLSSNDYQAYVSVFDDAPVAIIDSRVNLEEGWIELDARNSSSPNDDDGLADNNIEDYEWTVSNQFGSFTRSGDVVRFYPNFPGQDYYVLLTITDEVGLQDSANVQVAFADTPPTALIGATTSAVVELQLLTPLLTFEVTVDQLVNFATLSTDPENNIVQAHWDFDDGSAREEGPVVSHTFTEVGEYLITMEVIDASGNNDTAQLLLTVKAKPTPMRAVVGSQTTEEFVFGPIILGVIVGLFISWVLNMTYKERFPLWSIWTIVVVGVSIVIFYLYDFYWGLWP